MNDFKSKMKEKIKQYSKKEYLDGYIKDEFLTDDGDANVYLNISSISDLMDMRTCENQLDLNSEIYKYVEDKSSMLENDVQINLHITGYELDSKTHGMVKHIFKEHYAIELYKIQKKYVHCRNKIIALFIFGFINVLAFYYLSNYGDSNFMLEVFSFMFSFSIWQAAEALIYGFSDLKDEREAITQNLLINITFE